MKLLVLSGGRHPYQESTPVLGTFLRAAGHEVTITEDAAVLARTADMRGYDALVFNTRRENLPDFGDLALAQAEQDGLKDFIRSGKGFVCLHISTCLPKTWPEYHAITGGGVDYWDELPSTLWGVHCQRECPRPSGRPWCL